MYKSVLFGLKNSRLQRNYLYATYYDGEKQQCKQHIGADIGVAFRNIIELAVH